MSGAMLFILAVVLLVQVRKWPCWLSGGHTWSGPSIVKYWKQNFGSRYQYRAEKQVKQCSRCHTIKELR